MSLTLLGYARVPHGRGDGPDGTATPAALHGCSPRAWGWSGERTAQHLRGERVPHGRGDGPSGASMSTSTCRCSPRAWGWSDLQSCRPEGGRVFPTGVGMVRVSPEGAAACACVPHGRGDGPQSVGSLNSMLKCSPRAWGWSAGGEQPRPRHAVFPTGVGMVRERGVSGSGSRSVPHGRGDGPPDAPARARAFACSPRAWGWSAPGPARSRVGRVFPTGVGMVRGPSPGRQPPGSVPHGRGDGPAPPSRGSVGPACSPRAWGWSAPGPARSRVGRVFPTGVGMVRVMSGIWRGRRCVPHGRGDGPASSFQGLRKDLLAVWTLTWRSEASTPARPGGNINPHGSFSLTGPWRCR